MANILIVNIICYDESFKWFELLFFGNGVPLDPTYSRLAGTSLTVTTNFEGQRSNALKYPSDYLIQPPGKLTYSLLLVLK